jgi:hypothetical protein
MIEEVEKKVIVLRRDRIYNTNSSYLTETKQLALMRSWELAKELWMNLTHNSSAYPLKSASFDLE